ncbi:MAG: phosphatidylinositol-specific phospholipase C domain-containing protein [Clostridia bacterium]|nr:phosphatidylinositol-specific phospholipase C domain-containing protein [Clostridia bacterium]
MNILSLLSDKTYLSELNIAGTHDSATAYVAMENSARCQYTTISEQLTMGVRLLDIRLSKKGEEFYLVHSLADCYSDEEKTKRLSFGEVLNECKAFLTANPKETLILSVKQDRGIMSRGFFPRFYERYIKGDESSWYLENEMPTLGEIRGKIVLMRRCKVWQSYEKKVSCGLDFSYWKDQDRKKMKAETVILKAEKDILLSALVQDRYCLDPERKWQCIKRYLDCASVSPIKAAIHFLSTSVKTDGSLAPTAEYINEKFFAYNLKPATGWILCDFPTEALIKKIMMSNIEKSDVK